MHNYLAHATKSEMICEPLHKTLLSLKLLVDADTWQFWGKTKLIFYIFCLPSLFKKRTRATGQVEARRVPGAGLGGISTHFTQPFKRELGELQIYFKKIPLQLYINKNFWWFRFFLIRLGCREI